MFDDFKWYVIKSTPSSEQKLMKEIKNIVTKIGLDADVEEILVPSEKRKVGRGGKRVDSDVSLISGYVFIKMRSSKRLIDSIRNAEGFLMFLGQSSNGVIESIGDAEITQMLKALEESVSVTDNNELYVGRRVKIEHGVFSGFSGVIDSINSESKKLTLLVSIFGKMVPVELAVENVSLI